MEIPTTIRNNILEVFDDANGGTLRFHDASHTAIASLALSSPAFGTPSSGVITAGTITDDSSTAAGTVTHAHLYNVSGVELCTFTVGTSGAEIILSGLTFASGDTLAVSSLTITMPAS